jgi:O-antigen ligase
MSARQPVGFSPEDRAPSRWRLDNPTFLLHVSLILVGLAFMPFVPTADALTGGLSPSRIYETFFILVGFAMMPVFMLSKGYALSTRLHANWPVTLFCAWALVSFLWSYSPALTLSKGVQLTAIVVGALLFADAFRTFSSNQHDFAGTLAIVLVSLVVTALIANLFIWGSPFAMGGTEKVSIMEPRPRLRNAYGHPAIIGDLASLGLISIYAARLPWKVKWACAPLLFYVLWLSDARSGAAALTLAVIAMFLLKRGRKAILAALYALGWLIFSYLLIVNIGNRPDDLIGPIRPLLPQDLETLNGRTLVWSVAWEHILESPILGIGYYSSRFVLLPVIDWAGDTHNNWIELLLTTGLVGLALLIVFFVSSYSTALITKDALLLGVLTYATFYTVTAIPFFVPELTMVIVLLCVSYARIARLPAIAEPTTEVAKVRLDTGEHKIGGPNNNAVHGVPHGAGSPDVSKGPAS